MNQHESIIQKEIDELSWVVALFFNLEGWFARSSVKKWRRQKKGGVFSPTFGS